MSEFIRLQANGVDAFPDASTQNTYRPNGTSVENALVALESNVTTLGGVAGDAKTLAEQNSVKIATAEQEISAINSSLTFRYNAETDYFQALIDGMWANWKKSGFKEPISLIPIITSNTSSECTLSASTEFSGGSGYQAYRAFDGITGSLWQTANGSVPGWLQVKFNEEKVVKKFSINLGGTRSCTIILQASKNGSTWIDLATVTPNPEVTQEISNDNSYMYYRFYSASGYKDNGYSVFGMVEAQLYGY